MNSNTFSVLIWANKSKAKNGMTPLYARITVNGVRKEISLKRTVEIAQWCSKKNLVRGSKPQFRLLNQYLEECKASLFDSYRQLQNEKKFITAEIVVNKYLGVEESGYTLSKLMEYHNVHLRDTMAPGTLKNYFTTQKYLLEFLKTKKNTSDIYLHQLRHNFVIDFEIFLKARTPINHQKPCTQNGAMKHIERLRKMINLAVKNEWLKKDPFLLFRKKMVHKERNFLTPLQLASIEQKQLRIERLDTIRDLFVFSCYTGLSYVDVMQLQQSNLNQGIDGAKWLSFSRQKTAVSVHIPLLPKAEFLINKYATHPQVGVTGALFPKYSNQKLNSYLKELGDLCGISFDLTFHLARHTFATTITLSNGVPIETVSKLLGHTKLSTTQVYARVLKEKISTDMQVLKGKLDTISHQNHNHKAV